LQYVESISKADIDTADSLSLSNAKAMLELLKKSCRNLSSVLVTDESMDVLRKLKGIKTNSSEMRRILGNFDRILSEEKTKILDEVTKKYGEIKSLSPEKKKQAMEEVLDKASDIIAENVLIKLMDMYSIKTNSKSMVAKVLSIYMLRNRGQLSINWRTEAKLYEIAEELYSNIDIKPSKKCISHYGLTYMLNLKKVIPIDTNITSKDKAKVRLELVSEDDKSTKIILFLEKMQDQWKITDFERD